MIEKYTVDFIGVGFSRCGTTWISKCLKEHPEICFSEPKETHFFVINADYEKGLEHYKSFFKCDESKKVRGEYTPDYFLYDSARERIKKDLPKAKLIFSLRNPVDRAFSQYLYRQRKTGKKYPIEELFNQQNIRKENRILDFGFYYRNIVKWIKNLPENQYLVLVIEDYKESPQEFIQKIYRFLGVNDTFIPPSLTTEINTTKGLGYHSRAIQNIMAKRIPLKKSKWGGLIIKVLKVFGIGKLSEYLITRNKKAKKSEEKEKLSEDMRKRIRQVYDDDIKSLEKLINRDLSFWR